VGNSGYIQKKQLCFKKTFENHQLVYKLYNLIPDEMKIVEEFNGK